MYRFVDRNNIDDNISLLQEFEQSIFNKAFPDPNERESFTDDIIPRIKVQCPDEPQTFCILRLDDNGNILAGMVTDWYPECQSLEIIYIATDPSLRGNGIGKGILDNGIKQIREKLHADNNKIKHIFLEADIPFKTSYSAVIDESMNPVERITIWEKWGAKRIPINYTQPSLSQDKEPVNCLMLMSLTGYCNDSTEYIEAEDLKKFLTCFYKGLHAEESESLDKMLDDIDRLSKKGKIELETLTEVPTAIIRDAAVTIHFGIKGDLKIDLSNRCIDFNSFECDLMNFQNQKKRPFETRFIKLFKNIGLIMPSFYCYTSEGVTHYHKPIVRKLNADVSVSISCPSDMLNTDYIAHISIRPASGSAFCDLDYIRLISEFGSRQEEYEADSEILFEINDGCAITGKALLKQVFGACHSIMPLHEGISQFDIKGIHPLQGEEFDLKDFFRELNPNADTFKKMLCGLVLGIFDYNRMNAAEIEDTLRPVVSSSESYIIISRGNIFKIEDMDIDDHKSLQRIIISPYLLMPSAALAFNGIALDECEALIKEILNNRFNLNISGVIQKSEMVLDIKYMENIFQYQSEQDIIIEGERQRNMKYRFQKLCNRIDLLKKRAQKASDILVEGFLGIIATFGAMQVFAEGMQWSGIFIAVILAILGIEVFRWYKVRKMIDLN